MNTRYFGMHEGWERVFGRRERGEFGGSRVCAAWVRRTRATVDGNTDLVGVVAEDLAGRGGFGGRGGEGVVSAGFGRGRERMFEAGDIKLGDLEAALGTAELWVSTDQDDGAAAGRWVYA